MPVIVLLPLVPLTATPGRAVLTSSASSAGRATVVRSSARAASISGVSASTAVENTNRSIAALMAVPSCGTSSTPAARSAVAASALRPASKARSDP
jgi:hypothetical protein